AVAWAMYQQDQVTFGKAMPRLYASSAKAWRGFCENCGTQLSFAASFLPGLIDIPIGSLDNPEGLEPSLHYWHSKHLDCAEFDDNLPRHPEFPPMALKCADNPVLAASA